MLDLNKIVNDSLASLEEEKFVEGVVKERQVEFRIISSKNLDNLTLSYKQIVVLLEALYNFRRDVKNKEANSAIAAANIKYKLNEIDTLFEYLEHGIRYDFESAVNKCVNKRGKKKDDDPGMETMNWLAK